jgi:hypothetical protein
VRACTELFVVQQAHIHAAVSMFRGGRIMMDRSFLFPTGCVGNGFLSSFVAAALPPHSAALPAASAPGERPAVPKPWLAQKDGLAEEEQEGTAPPAGHAAGADAPAAGSASLDSHPAGASSITDPD